ncbi:hypothetical protein LOK49_LG01G02094 [Camellia lanceoleosa]|uniref:Uncharacterized protein n=1 Tax=Camellia lanceoleosa TaxID=1840588 RepID=A0ACC0J1R3_9ERIC|nr:hypothetical protein LOK49_LG01G02094 [Camellia lanceoleosa]
MKRCSSSGKRVHGRPTGGKNLSESKLVLNPNGSCCADVKAMNSGGKSESEAVGESSSILKSSSLGAESVMTAAVSAGMGGGLRLLREQEELKVVEMNKVRRFVDKRRKRKKRLVERDLVLEFGGRSTVGRLIEVPTP